MIYLVFFLVFYFGALWGSFLYCVALRYGKKTLIDRSNCTHCKKKLGFLNLFPIFSFLFQKFRCSFCFKKINPNYFLAEILTGLIFLFTFIKFIFLTESTLNNLLLTSFWLLISAILIIIFFYDAKNFIIPDFLIFLLFLLGLFYSFFDFETLSFVFLKINLNPFILATPIFLIWLIGYFLKKEFIGFGDIKLYFVLGFFVNSFIETLSLLFLPFYLGSVWIISLFIFSKIFKTNENFHNRKIPFAPFIILAFWLVLFLEINIFFFSFSF